MRIVVLGMLVMACLQWISSDVLAQTVDNPLQLTPFHPTNVTLDRNAIDHFSISLPTGRFKLVVDTRRPDKGNLISTVALLDEDGAVIKERIIAFNEIDWGYRRVYSFEVKQPKRFRFKLTNYHDRADFWVTVAGMPKEKSVSAAPGFNTNNVRESDLAEYDAQKADIIPVPFFGTIAPHLAIIGEAKAGSLREGESDYYVAAVPKGGYRIVLGFDHANGENGNLIGYVALLEQDEGGQRALINLNEIDVSTRKTTDFEMKNTSVIVLRVENGHRNPVNYMLRIRLASED